MKTYHILILANIHLVGFIIVSVIKPSSVEYFILFGSWLVYFTWAMVTIYTDYKKLDKQLKEAEARLKKQIEELLKHDGN